MEIDLGKKILNSKGEEVRHQEIKTEKGKTVFEDDGKTPVIEDYGVLRMGDVFALSLSGNYDEKIAGEKKRKRYHLWQKVEAHIKARKPMKISDSEKELLKEAIDLRYGTLIYGQAMDVLDPDGNPEEIIEVIKDKRKIKGESDAERS